MNISNTNNKLLLALLLATVGCSPSIKRINGYASGDKGYYLVNGSVNTLEIRGGNWHLDSVSHARVLDQTGKNIRLFVDSVTSRSDLKLYFSSGNKIEVVTLDHGSNPHPLLRYYPNNQNVAFDNLRFFKLMAVNSPDSPEIIDYRIEKMYVSFGSRTYSLPDGTFSPTFLHEVFDQKPRQIIIDSVEIVDNNGRKFKQLPKLGFTLSYSAENAYSCLEDDDAIDFQNVLRANSQATSIMISRNTVKCPIIFFHNFGSEFSVEVRSTTGEHLYGKNLKAGELSIDNYFIFENYSELLISISGDYSWSGKLMIE